MSFSLVQSNAAQSSTLSATLTMTSSVTAGNLLYVSTGAYTNGTGSSYSSIADSQGNTYTTLETEASGNDGGTLVTYYCNVKSTGSLAITCTGAITVQKCQIAASEYNCASGWAYANKSSTNGEDQETFQPGSMSFSGTGLVLVSTYATDATSLAAGSGYTLLQSTGSSPCLGTAYLLNSTSSPVNPSMTASAFSFDWACAGAVFTVVVPMPTLAIIASGDTFSGSGGFKATGSLSKTAANDTFAATGHAVDPATLVVSAASDTFSAVGGFKSAATLAITAAADHLSATGFNASSGAMSIVASPDHFSAAAALSDVTILSIHAASDSFYAFAYISPYMRVRAANDTFAGSGGFKAYATGSITASGDTFAATGGITSPATMAITAAGDVFAAYGGFSYDTRAYGVITAANHTFAGTGFSSASATMAMTAASDHFSATAHFAATATLAIYAASDVFRAGIPNRIVYDVFESAVNEPISYSAAVSQVSTTTWTSGTLTVPGTYQFAVRAGDLQTQNFEQNLDCFVSITFDANGNDISDVPNEPIGLRCFPAKNGSVVVEWQASYVSTPAQAPTSYNVYSTTSTPLTYSSPTTTVPATAAFQNMYQANLTGFTDRQTVTVGVRSMNQYGSDGNTNTVSCIASATPPLAVVGLTAIAIV